MLVLAKLRSDLLDECAYNGQRAMRRITESNRVGNAEHMEFAQPLREVVSKRTRSNFLIAAVNSG